MDILNSFIKLKRESNRMFVMGLFSEFYFAMHYITKCICFILYIIIKHFNEHKKHCRVSPKIYCISRHKLQCAETFLYFFPLCWKMFEISLHFLSGWKSFFLLLLTFIQYIQNISGMSFQIPQIMLNFF